MRLNHSVVIVDFIGNPMKSGENDLTFRDLVIMTINNGDPNERIGAEKKAKIFGLCTKFYRGKFVNLTVDEAALIKERAGELATPMAYGRLCEWLEGEEQFMATDVEESEGENEGEE